MVFRNSGFYVAVSHHLAMPIMRQSSVKISPGTDVSIAVTPTILSTKNNAKRFDPIYRQCYFEKEFDLQYLPYKDFGYQMSNCLFEAVMERTIYTCDCHPLPVGFLKFNLSQHSCHGKKLLCDKRHLSKYLSEKELFYNF